MQIVRVVDVTDLETVIEADDFSLDINGILVIRDSGEVVAMFDKGKWISVRYDEQDEPEAPVELSKTVTKDIPYEYPYTHPWTIQPWTVNPQITYTDRFTVNNGQ